MIHKFFSFLIFSLLSSCSARNLHSNFQHIEVNEPETITGLRMVQRDNQPYILIARTTELFEATIPEKIKHPLVFTGAGFLDSPNNWDARPVPNKKNAYLSINLFSGSAFTWVMAKDPVFLEGHRIHGDTFVVYDHPRFSKGHNSSLTTAIRYKDGKSIPVAFGTEGEFSLGEFSDSIIDARLAKVGDKFWLFMLLEDSSLDDRVRKLPSVSRRGGVLSLVQFNEKFEALTQKTKLFSSIPIYEFDVDVTADNKIVLFASTHEGALFAHTTLIPNQPIAETEITITKLEMPLESPSISVVGDSAHMAALENPGLPEASIFYKKYRVKK